MIRFLHRLAALLAPRPVPVRIAAPARRPSQK
jgi:hypothetical protein